MRWPLRRRRRAGESGQGVVEWMVVGLVGVGAAAGVLVLVGGYLAVTYDQHHSTTALNGAAANTPPPEAPSVVFVDFSPVGLNEACILKAAAAQGLTWDGGELGWSAASNPRPRTGDPDYTAKLRAWRGTMTGLLSAASSSAGWQACLKPELTPPPQRTQEPTEALNPDGTYTIDPSGVQAIGGCGSDIPTSMTIAGGGSSATVVIGSSSVTLGGSFDKTSSSIQVQNGSSNGTMRTLRGSFSSNAGVTRFDGEYETTDAVAGCGYQFTAQKR